jgi:hypothetical protein
MKVHYDYPYLGEEGIHKLYIIIPATPTSLCSTLLTLQTGSCFPAFSVNNIQTAQVTVRLPTSKLPQPRVHLEHVAPLPAISCCCVCTAHWESRSLVFAVLVWNGRSRAASKEQGHQGHPAYHVGSWSDIDAWGW